MIDILKAIETLTKIVDWIRNRKDETYPSNKQIAIQISARVGELVDRFEEVAEGILLLFYEEREQEAENVTRVTYPHRVKINSLNRSLLRTFRKMQLVYWDLDAALPANLDAEPLRRVLEACGQILQGEGDLLLVTEAQRRAIDNGLHRIYHRAERENAISARYFDAVLREIARVRHKLQQLERII